MSCRLLLAPLMLAGTLLAAPATPEPFRPKAGEFPPLAMAHSYRGELVFVDHANRRGSLRVQGSGMFFRNDPHPIALLPYAEVRQFGAPADLRDLPLGSLLHAKGFLPPDPKTSCVPVLPVDNKTRDGNHNRGAGIFPAENHLLLLEDEPSRCLREGKIWQLNSLEFKGPAGLLEASCQPLNGNDAKAAVESLGLDQATRFWRGRELLNLSEWLKDTGLKPEGKQDLKALRLHLSLTWKPTADGIFTRLHVSDVWLDDAALHRAAQRQRQTHLAFMRSRWLPAFVDGVQYGKFGRASITLTLFGGMDEELYADFKQGAAAMINAAESNLKHLSASNGPAHMASKGSILEVQRRSQNPPPGSSGLQLRFETDLIIEGIRPGRVVRIRPRDWPQVNLPREEYISDGAASLEERFPTPAMFPKY